MAQLKTFNKFGELLDDRQILDTFEDHLLLSCGHEEGQPYWFTATLNGHPWTSYTQALTSSDVIEVNIEPKWAAVPYIIAVVAAAYSYYVAKGIDRPTHDYQKSLEAGKSIYSASARANSISPSGSIREISGEITIFPEYIIPPYRRYIDNKEVLFMMFSVGAGHFDMNKSNITIAETPLNRYTGQFEVDIFEPGDDVTQHPASEYWYKTKEVSAVSLLTDREGQFGDWTATFSGDEITSFFEGIASPFPFVIGAAFEILEGDNAGNYRVETLSGSVLETATVLDTILIDGLKDKLAHVTRYPRGSSTWTTYEQRILDQGGTPATLVAAVLDPILWEATSAGIRWFGPFVLTPDNELSNEFELDVFFPSGLGKRNDTTGFMELYTVELAVEYRNYGDVEWISAPLFSWTESTRDQQGRTIRITTDKKIRPEMRFRRTTQDSEQEGIYDDMEVRSIKTKLDIQSSYPEITTIAFSIVSDEGLSKQSESQINIRGARRKLPTLNEIQALSWDLSDSVTKAGDFYSLADTTYLGSATRNKFIKGSAIPYTDPCIDVSNDGGLMIVTVGRRYYKIYTLLDKFNVETTRTTSAPREIDITLPFSGFSDTIARFGNDTHSKWLLLVQHVGSNTAKLVIWDRFSQEVRSDGDVSLGIVDAYSRGDGLMFFSGFAGALGVVVRTYSTAWDLTTPTGPLTTFYDFDANFPAATLKSLTFSKTGLKMFILASGDIYEFDLDVAWSNSNITHVGTRTQFQTNNPLYISVSAERLVFTERESNTQINQYRLNVFNDTRATRSAVRFCAYILWQAMGDKVVDQVDWSAMDDLDVLLESRDDNLDGEFVDETTLWEVLRSALLVGYSEPTIKSGLFTPIRVSAGTDFKQLYTPDIMIGELQYDQPFFDGQDADGVEVEYFDTLNNQTNTIIVNDGVDQGLRPSRVQAIGITDREKAFRFGMRQYNRERYRPARITFTTEMDALNSEYGDPIAIGSSLWGSQFGEIMNYNNILKIATLSFIPQFAVGDHFLSLRDKEGSTEIYQCTAVGGEPFQVELVSNPTFDPVFGETIDSTFVTFGTAEDVFIRAIVRKIEPQDETTVQITAEEYLDLVYQSDNATLGGAPWIVPNQILNYNESRVEGESVGFVDIGGQYTPEEVGFEFDNGTQLSDDGFFFIGTGPVDAGQIIFTAAGVASDARNDFDTLPNTSFYAVRAIFNSEESDLTTITLKVKESAVPPDDSIYYSPIENFSEATGSLRSASVGNDELSWQVFNETFVVDIDGLLNFGFGSRANRILQDSSVDIPNSIRKSTVGTMYFLVDLSFSNGDSNRYDMRFGNVNSSGGARYGKIEFERLNSITALVTIEAFEGSFSTPVFTATSTVSIASSGFRFFALSSNGSAWTFYMDGTGFETLTPSGDAGFDGYWFSDMFGSRDKADTDLIEVSAFDSSDGAVIAHGMTSVVMTQTKLDKLASFMLDPDT